MKMNVNNENYEISLVPYLLIRFLLNKKVQKFMNNERKCIEIPIMQVSSFPGQQTRNSNYSYISVRMDICIFFFFLLFISAIFIIKNALFTFTILKKNILCRNEKKNSFAKCINK